MHRLWRLLAPDRREVGSIYVYARSPASSVSACRSVQAIVGLVSGGMLLQPVVLLIGFVVPATFFAGVLRLLQLAVVEPLQQLVFARVALGAGRPQSPAVELEAHPGQPLPEGDRALLRDSRCRRASPSSSRTPSPRCSRSRRAGAARVLHPTCRSSATCCSRGSPSCCGSRDAPRCHQPGGGAPSTASCRGCRSSRDTPGAFRPTPGSRLPIARMDQDLVDYLAPRQAHFRVLAKQSIAAVPS